MLNKYCSSLFLSIVVGMGVSLTGCRHEKPNTIYMPDMVYSPALKAQEEGADRLPVAGTVPRDFNPYAHKNNPNAAAQLKNPLPRTEAVIKRGQYVFNIYCSVCHGKQGLGDGSIVPKFPRPPSLQSDKVRQWPDGSIFHVITMGQNLMPSYASQVREADRWALIHYIRVLQRSQNPSAEDLKILEQESK